MCGRLRRDGFATRARELGNPIVADRLVGNVRSIADGRRIVRDLLSEGPPIGAVFAANDLLAIGALLEACAMGLAIPDDIAILGMGDARFADEMTLSLSIIVTDGPSIGRQAGELLRQRLDGQVLDRPTRHVPLVLNERGST